MRERRGAILLGLGLAVGGAALFGKAFARGEIFVERDLFSYYQPAKALLVRLVQEAHGLPHWNPYFASGQPFAANPEHELFHPLTWLLLVLPFGAAFRLQVILPVLAAAPAMAFLLRTLGRAPRIAAIGGLAWAFGGYVLSTTNLLPILFAVAVLPSVLAAAVRAARSGRARDAALLALLFGLECLAGEPSTLLATPLLAAAAIGGDHRRRARPRLGAPLLGLALGGALGAAALLPGTVLAARTIRAEGFGREESENWSLPPVRLAELVWPTAMGHVEKGRSAYRAASLYPNRFGPFLYSLYPGILVTFAAAAAFAVRRRRSLLAWGSVGLAGLGLAAGSHLPFWRLARAGLPLFAGLRYPEKLWLLPAVVLVVLAAEGVAWLLGRRARARRAAAAVFVMAGVFAAASLVSFGGDSGADLVRVALAAAGTAGALALASRWRRAAPFALALVLVADLVGDGRRLVPSRKLSFAAPPVLHPLLATPLPGPVFHLAGWSSAWEPGEGIVRPPRTALWGIATTYELDFDETELLWSHRARDRFQEILEVAPPTGMALLKRRGVAAVIRYREDVRVEGRKVLPAEGSDQVVEPRFLAGSRPFAFVAERVERVRGEAGWKSRVLALGPEARDAVLVDESEPLPAAISGGRVTRVERRPDSLAIDVDAAGPSPSLVAINQTWDRYWSARVDGALARLLRVDLALSAVVVPPGRHTIALTYHDPWPARGAAVSSAALLAILALAWRGRRGA